MSGKVWQILIAAALGVILLVGLGMWQLQRLAWKEALIAERDMRLAAAPVTLDQALKEFDADRSVEFLKVKSVRAASELFRHCILKVDRCDSNNQAVAVRTGLVMRCLAPLAGHA